MTEQTQTTEMTVAELLAQKKALDEAIVAAKAEQAEARKEALAEIQRLMLEFSISKTDLFPRKQREKKEVTEEKQEQVDNDQQSDVNSTEGQEEQKQDEAPF